MRIGLLGGAFDPPHLGHCFIAQQILDFGLCDEVWFVPAYAHTFQKPMSSVSHRLAMAKLLDIPNTFVSSIEIDHKLDGQTIRLLPLLSKEHEYMFIIGSDQLATFHLWGSWEELLQKIPFLVFPRYGYPSDPLYKGMRVISDSLLIATNISSTKVRGRIKRGLSIDQFVPKNIAEYIRKNKLYI